MLLCFISVIIAQPVSHVRVDGARVSKHNGGFRVI